MSPSLLESTGFLKKVGRVVVPCGEATYRSAGVENEIDFYVVSKEILWRVTKCSRIETTEIPKHSPVLLEMQNNCENYISGLAVNAVRCSINACSCSVFCSMFGF